MITESQKRRLQKIIQKAASDEEVLAVFLYGSRIDGSQTETPESDLDICLVLQTGGRKVDPHGDAASFTRKRLSYLSAINPEKLDIQIFQQLPIYVRKEVLAKGKLEYCRDKNTLYQMAYRTVQEYEDFAPRFREYLYKTL